MAQVARRLPPRPGSLIRGGVARALKACPLQARDIPSLEFSGISKLLQKNFKEKKGSSNFF